MGTEAGLKVECAASFLSLIGIGVAKTLLDGSTLLLGGEGETPAGEAIRPGCKNSSKFIASEEAWLTCSLDLRSCAMPEGVVNIGREGL